MYGDVIAELDFVFHNDLGKQVHCEICGVLLDQRLSGNEFAVEAGHTLGHSFDVEIVDEDELLQLHLHDAVVLFVFA